MRVARAPDLLFISKSPKAKIDLFKAGVSLETRTGYKLDELAQKATADRLDLAREFIRQAETAALLPNHCYRTAVSRAYYSMYHVFRAVSYFVHGGDDHEEHTKLPGAIPPDFPTPSYWENELKSARLERNRADYDPYPRNEDQFEAVATNLIGQARTLMAIARSYLRGKGCSL